MKSHCYSINGNEYTFKPLVIGQIKQLIELDVEDIPEGADLLNYFIQKIPASKVLAILLHPKSYHIMEKEIEQLEKEIEFEIEPIKLENMVSDFFALCPLDQIIADVGRVAKSNQDLRRLI